MKDYFILAFKNLKRRGIRSWLTLLGVLIGIAAVVSLISLGNGLKDAVNSQFSLGTTEVITVRAGGISGFGPPGSGVSVPLTVDDAKALERISSVDLAIPRLIETAAVSFRDRTIFEAILSIPEDKKQRDFFHGSLELKTSSGKLLKEGDGKKVVMGNDLSFGDGNGFDRNVKTGDSLEINERRFKVAGILEKKGSFIIDGAIFMPEDELRELNDIGDRTDFIMVKVKNKDLMDKAKDEIEKVLRERRKVKKGSENFEVSTPESSLESVNQILTGIQVFIVVIASMSIIVGVIGISNTMATSVIERKKEIGVMKSIGARNENVFYQFLIEAGLLGFVGGIIGVSLGVGMGYAGTTAMNGFLGISTAPNFDLTLMFFSLLGSFVIGAVSGIIPAMKAARQNPVDSLRK